MKQVIYMDVLIFLNTVITFLLLLAVSKLTKLTPAPGRYVIGAILGGASSLIIFAPNMGFVLSVFTKLLFSLIIVSVTYNPRAMRAILKQTGYFFAVSFIFAGIMLFVSSLPGISIVSYNNGIAYIDLSLFSLISAAVMCYIITCILNKITRHRHDGDILYNIKISNNGKTVSLSSILDTGNALTDPFTGENLIIASKRDIDKILPSDVRYYLNGETQKCKSIRLVPCCTIASESLLPVFRAEHIQINGDGVHLEMNDVGVAVCSTQTAQVILPPNILVSERRRKNEIAFR